MLRNRQGGINKPSSSTSLCNWVGKIKELRELFQTLLLEGCIALNRINGGCSGTERYTDGKNKQTKTKGTKQHRGCSQLQRNSFRFLVQDFPQFEALGMAMSLSVFLSGVWCCNLSWPKEPRQVQQQQQQGEAPGMGRRLHTVSWCQYWFISEIITGDQRNSSTGLCKFICLHRTYNCWLMKIALVSHSFALN